MPLKQRVLASDLACFAEVALRLGFDEIGQQLMTAAYDHMNGKPVPNQSDAFERLWFASLDAGRMVSLTDRHIKLLRSLSRE